MILDPVPGVAVANRDEGVGGRLRPRRKTQNPDVPHILGLGGARGGGGPALRHMLGRNVDTERNLQQDLHHGARQNGELIAATWHRAEGDGHLAMRVRLNVQRVPHCPQVPVDRPWTGWVRAAGARPPPARALRGAG